jgi:hypothetical protein
MAHRFRLTIGLKGLLMNAVACKLLLGTAAILSKVGQYRGNIQSSVALPTAGRP